MVKAFVFGKFLPFHSGHEALIRFARTHCDELTVLVCASDREAISGETRQQWISETFAGETGIRVRAVAYNEDELPNTSASSRAVSELWAATFSELLPDCTLVVTSEPYGVFVAEYMNIKHLSFDPVRSLVPVSGTMIRNDPHGLRKFLPPAVKAFYTQKVVVLGTESTGKTTLTQQLAEHFGCAAVFEAGRDLIPDSRAFSEADLYAVAEEHARRITVAVRGDHPLVVIDTDIHITRSYGRFAFGKELNVNPDTAAANRADLYLYLANDVPFVQDGTRLDRQHRDALDASHRSVLRDSGIVLIEIAGTWEERFDQAVKAVSAIGHAGR